MRANSRVIILVVAALIAALTAVVVRKKLSGLQGSARVEKQIDSKRILVAKRDVQPGRFIDATTDLEWANPSGDEEVEVIRESVSKKSDFNGGVVRRPLKTGKAVSPDSITKAGDGGFLSAVLEAGMRAVAIAVNTTTGAAGFIAPGDRVDLIVTHRIKASRSGDGSDQDTVVSETFVRDVRVVAVDQSIDAPENKATIAKNVTVEVTEGQAEQIAVAIEMGKISLALRSALTDKDKEADAVHGTRGSDIIPSLRSGGVAPRVQVIRGEEKENLQFLNQGAR